jgi:hypothetical protein
VNWTAASALAAWAGVGILYWQVRQQIALSRFTTGIDSLWHLEDRWTAPAMLQTRRQAAVGLLQNAPTQDIEAVLDFFELLALLVKRDLIDAETAWHAYYWPLAHYWAAAQSYIRQTRQDEGIATWEDLEALVRSLTTIEAEKRRIPVSEVLPKSDQTKKFLATERNASSSLDE